MGISNPSSSGFGTAIYNGTFTGGNSSNFWSTTGAQSDFTLTGSLTLTQLTNAGSVGFGTVTAAASSFPGITFTPLRTGLVEIIATPYGGTDASSNVSVVSFFLVDGSNVKINQASCTESSTQVPFTPSIIGEYLVTAGIPVTFKLQGSAGVGTIYIFNQSDGWLLNFAMKYVT